MILVAFIPGTRSTLTMEILRALGAHLLCDRLPLDRLKHPSVQEAIAAGDIKVTAMSDTHFEVEQKRQEITETGIGLDTTGKPANAAAKLIAFPAIQQSKVSREDRVVFLVRNPADTCRSQAERNIFREHRMNYHRFVHHFEAWADSAPCPVLYLDTDEMMRAPAQVVARLAEFTGLAGNILAAAALVDPTKARPRAEDAEDEARAHYRKVKAKCR